MTGKIAFMNGRGNLHAVRARLLVCTNRVSIFVVLSGPLRSQSQHRSSLFFFFSFFPFFFFFVCVCVSLELSYSSTWRSFLIFLMGVLCDRALAHDFGSLVYLVVDEFS